jgi:IS605 OrfB family transposase
VPDSIDPATELRSIACVRTRRFKVRSEAYPWLNRAAREVNDVRRIINQFTYIVIGEVSSRALTKTRMAKSVLDSGWGMLKTYLQYKGAYAGREVHIVNERNTSRACSSCRSLTGPKGINGLRVRQWICSGCGVTHDRDVNAARNILAVGRSPPSVVGNEPPSHLAPPSRASRPREARSAPDAAAA